MRTTRNFALVKQTCDISFLSCTAMRYTNMDTEHANPPVIRYYAYYSHLDGGG